MKIPDQHRADLWDRRALAEDESGTMPALEILRLPNYHTEGARPGSPTPRAFMADNDLALGRVVEAISKSRFWTSTADDVRVRVDEARQQRDVAEIHQPRTDRNGHRALFSGGDDLVVGHNNDAIRDRGGTSAIDEPSRAKRDGAGTLELLRVERRGRGEEESRGWYDRGAHCSSRPPLACRERLR